MRFFYICACLALSTPLVAVIPLGKNSKTAQGLNPVEQLFQDGDLIARTFFVKRLAPAPGDKCLSSLIGAANRFEEFEKEFDFLNQSPISQGGVHQNVERSGQRSRSASLLVPGVSMQLLFSLGLLYDADKSTIRAYMFADAGTSFQTTHTGFYNTKIDQKKFAPILSRKEFLTKYKDFRAWRDKLSSAEIDVQTKATGLNLVYEHNEVIGNFFPGSLLGLVAAASANSERSVKGLENKFELLQLQYHLKTTQGFSLPMYFFENGRIEAWTPDLAEVARLATSVPNYLKLMRISCPKAIETLPLAEQMTLFEAWVKSMGFEIKPAWMAKLRSATNTAWNISKDSLSPIDVQLGPKTVTGGAASTTQATDLRVRAPKKK